MQTDNSGMTRLKESAITALLVTNTRAEAAEYAGCSERSIYNWLNDPLFNNVLLQRENVLRREVGRRLAMDAKQALAVIQDVMNDQRKDAGLRLRAADLWLKYLLNTQDQTDLERRLSALEAKA